MDLKNSVDCWIKYEEVVHRVLWQKLRKDTNNGNNKPISPTRVLNVFSDFDGIKLRIRVGVNIMISCPVPTYITRKGCIRACSTTLHIIHFPVFHIHASSTMRNKLYVFIRQDTFSWQTVITIRTDILLGFKRKRSFFNGEETYCHFGVVSTKVLHLFVYKDDPLEHETTVSRTFQTSAHSGSAPYSALCSHKLSDPAAWNKACLSRYCLCLFNMITSKGQTGPNGRIKIQAFIFANCQ